MHSNLTLRDIPNKITRKFNPIIIITLLFTLIGLGITLLLPKQYRAESKLVVLQKANSNVDSYTAQRSIDSKIELLIDLVYTDIFFISVITDNAEIKNLFPATLKDRRALFVSSMLVMAVPPGSLEVADTFEEDALLNVRERL